MGKTADIEKAKKLIFKLRSKNKSCRINSVYSTQSEKEMLDIVDFCIQNGVEKYSIALCFSQDSNLPSIKETNFLGEKIKSYIRLKLYKQLYFAIEGCMIYSSFTNINGKIVETEFQKKQYGCECGNTIMEILPDGSMYACAAFISQSKSIGNAFDNCWKDIWFNSIDLKYLRESKCTDERCIKCGLYHFCNGGCPAFKEYQGIGNVFSTYDSRCELYNIAE